jgi:Na+/H+ antiporter NhaD/arsenite permease-like protein
MYGGGVARTVPSLWFGREFGNFLQNILALIHVIIIIARIYEKSNENVLENQEIAKGSNQSKFKRVLKNKLD